MSGYPLVPLGEILAKSDDLVSIEPDERYKTAGILNRGRGLFARPIISGSDTRYSKYNRLHSGQFVYSKLFAWEGALATVTPEFDKFFVSHEFPTFDIIEKRAIPSYVAYLAQWSELHGALSKQTSGMGSRRQRVNIAQMLSETLQLPKLGEQRRLVGKLDSILGRASAVRELHARSASLQKSLAESLIEEAAASSSETVQVGEIVVLERSSITIDPEIRYRVIGAKSFGKGIIYYPPALGDEVSKLNYFKLPADALLLSNIKAWEGAISVTTEAVARDYIASNRFLSYMPRDERVNTSYLRHYFLSRRGLAQVSAASPGGADRNRTLGRSRFESLMIPLPPRSEQDRIARILDSLGERARKAAASPALDSLRPSILNAAFTGQL